MLFVIAKLALWSRPSVVLRDFRMSVTRQMARTTKRSNSTHFDCPESSLRPLSQAGSLIYFAFEDLYLNAFLIPTLPPES